MSVSGIRNFDWKSFHALEKQNALFDMTNPEGIFFWDIIRYEVYSQLLVKASGLDAAVKPGSAKMSVLKRVFITITSLLSLMIKIIGGKFEFLVLATSRNKIGNDKYHDQNMEDVLKMIHDNSLILETFEYDKRKYHYPHAVFLDSAVIRMLISWRFKKYSYNNLIDLIVKEYGPLPNLTNNKINQLVNNFKADLKFYRFLIRKKDIKAVFLTQNGIQKGLFAAAAYQEVPTIEFQHGLIENAHIAYSYNKDIIYKPSSLNLPDYFFSFSPYWTETIFFPVKNVVPLGNSAFYNNLVLNDNELVTGEGIVVASANIYGEQLKELILDFTRLDQTTPVYFKLHPNQWGEVEYYKKSFSAVNNVKVITNEKSMGQLILSTKATVIIKSTAIYEALQAQRIGLVYEIPGININEDLHRLNNVFFIKDALALQNVLNGRQTIHSYKAGFFFKNFDAALFTGFLREIKKDRN